MMQEFGGFVMDHKYSSQTICNEAYFLLINITVNKIEDIEIK